MTEAQLNLEKVTLKFKIILCFSCGEKAFYANQHSVSKEYLEQLCTLKMENIASCLLFPHFFPQPPPILSFNLNAFFFCI